MMTGESVKGIGVDLAMIPRMRKVIERWDDRFLRRVFTEEEIAYCQRRRDPVPPRRPGSRRWARGFGWGCDGRSSR
jgi:phosphopantetheinyl transferase (holo-ACP synthase)